ncbi:divergent PAP2 family protein [Paenibacillus sp. GYB003]|uniref:divergent PAP2 family protein n=1 Tax=Paenibacillus sp. GYB003 TaxID=2994392 RepID=UPI002F9659F6
MNILYLVIPILSWIVSGTIKFLINYFKNGSEALKKVGNGGFPSTHTSVVSSVTFLILFSEGFTSTFSVSVALLMIVIIDATGIRRSLGKHATIINFMNKDIKDFNKLREQQGHNIFEVIGGLMVGAILGYLGSLLIF